MFDDNVSNDLRRHVLTIRIGIEPQVPFRLQEHHQREPGSYPVPAFNLLQCLVH